MIPCPIQNTAEFKTAWLQKRPRVTQKFGLNPQIYKQFGLKGHNGVDYGVPVGTKIFAPIRGRVKIEDQKENGYGLYMKIRDAFGREVVLAHLSKVFFKSGDEVKELDVIGLSGNSGFSTGPHLHFGLRECLVGLGDFYSWPVKNSDNGFSGYFDQLPFVFNWKGTELKNDL